MKYNTRRDGMTNITTSPNFNENWTTADSAELTQFSDCVRVTLNWTDGAYVSFLEEMETLAVTLARLGWESV